MCKYQLFFSLKTDNLIINRVPYKHTMPESLSSQSDKKINGSSKITISQLFSELGKICTTLSYIQKAPIFYLFLKLRKPEKSIKSNIQKSQNLFVNREKLGIIAWDQRRKILNLLMILKTLKIQYLLKILNWERLYVSI